MHSPHAHSLHDLFFSSCANCAAVAAQNGHKSIAKLALRFGANINTQNYKGNTALHYCYAFGYVALAGTTTTTTTLARPARLLTSRRVMNGLCTEYLISKGANPRIINNFGLTCTQGLDNAKVLAAPVAVDSPPKKKKSKHKS
jgi:hypothetical protein